MSSAKKRYDNSPFKATIDENGFLVDNPIVARVGVQVYYDQSGNAVREFRPAEEVFKEESLSSFQGKPVTLDHVTVNSDNAKQVVVGSVSGKAEQVGSNVVAPVVIYDKNAIEQALAKEAAELSVGYTANIQYDSGFGDPIGGAYVLKKDGYSEAPSPDWQEFDAIQRDINVNHVAMVYRGRAGVAKLNLDGEQENPYNDDVQLTKEDSGMIKIKLDGAQEFEIAPEVAAHIEAIKADAKDSKEKIEGITAERDMLKAKVDGVDKEIEAAIEKYKADAAVMADLVAKATEAGVKCDGLDAKQIKVAYVKEVSGLDVAEKSDAYIDAAFDIAKESDKMAEVRTKVDGVDKSDSAEVKALNPNARLAKIIK
ncbi:MAG: DUF2213 domain-containing protein [Bacteroidales bacterium]|nr:DUF2213 domain-containing protein [Bacteroidales bacterium]